jgi:hypothetical protein
VLVVLDDDDPAAVDDRTWAAIDVETMTFSSVVGLDGLSTVPGVLADPHAAANNSGIASHLVITIHLRSFDQTLDHAPSVPNRPRLGAGSHRLLRVLIRRWGIGTSVTLDCSARARRWTTPLSSWRRAQLQRLGEGSVPENQIVEPDQAPLVRRLPAWVDHRLVSAISDLGVCAGVDGAPHPSD